MDQIDDDYWYKHRDELRSGMVFRTRCWGTVKLDRPVPGDGTQWYVANLFDNLYYISWCYGDNRVEPGDLIGQPLREEES